MTTIIAESQNIQQISARVPKSLRQELVSFVKKNYPKSTSLILYVDDDEIEVFEDGTTLTFKSADGYHLPWLFAVDKKGKERVWKIWTFDGTVYKSYGEIDGLKVCSERTYKGVNIGKVNETTAEEQAKREAERDWVKQLDKGYAPKPGKGDDIAKKILDAKKKQGNVNVNISALIRGVDPAKKEKKNAPTKPKAANKQDNGTIPNFVSDLLPMHCQPWSNEPKVLKYFDFDEGVYIQPKLDGIRCLVQLKKHADKLNTVLLSRKGKQFVWLNHLREEAREFLSGYEDIVLDCEVYAEVVHGKLASKGKKAYVYEDGDPELPIEQRFDVISGAVRPVRNEPHPLEDQLCLYVFDIADSTGEMDQDHRFEIIKELFSRKDIPKGCPHIKRVETHSIYYVEEIEDFHDEVASKGYEGVVIRSRDLKYESNGRSLMMRKHKHFVEEEYPITDVTCDEGVDREHFTWVCEKIVEKEDGMTELKTFNVKPMGTREQKWDWYDHADDYLGKLLTVRYQRADEEQDGVPRFPRGKAIRDYE